MKVRPSLLTLGPWFFLVLYTLGSGLPLESCAAAENAAETRLAEDLQYLASDERQGRGPYSEGLEQAAQYIADQFQQAGLNTNLIENEPFQTFSTRTRLEPGKKNELSFRLSGPNARLSVPQDAFQTLSPSTSGEFDLPVVFAGYGITSPQDGYDDYAGTDVEGKAVIVVRHEPDQLGRTGRFAGSANSKHAFLSTKIINAMDHGAAAIVLVTDEVAIRKHQPVADELLSFQVRMPDEFQPGIPVIHVRRSIVDDLLSQANQPSLSQWEASIDKTLQPESFPLDGVHLTGRTEIRRGQQSQRNVLGVLPGAGELAGQVVVVGAHYDHLGLGGAGSLAPWTREIHNGADDNASGTAALLEAARQWAASKPVNRRTVLFIAFAAEEQGLIGSEFYVRHPLFDLENTVAMLNFDMVGRLRNERLTAYGFDTAKQFEGWLDEAAADHDIELNKVAGGYGPSDHASFYGRGIPVLHFFTGFHSDYHRPSDDFERVNIEGLQRIVAMNVDLLERVATQQIEPIRGSEGSLLDLYFGGMDSKKEDHDATPAAPRRRTLGIVIGQNNTTNIAVGRVIPGSVAQQSGLLAGDVIGKWNGEDVHDLAELTAAVQAAKPKQKIPVRVRRGSLELELEVEFPF